MACALTDFRDKPAGTIRITTAGHAADAYIWPALSNVLPDYPDLKIEVTVDYGLADIVAERYDIGIRLGDQVAKDMIAVPISPMQRMAVVALPDYVRAPHHPRRAGRAGPAQLHRLAPAHPWWPAALGFRKGRPRGQGARGRPMDLQRQQRHPACRVGRRRTRVLAGNHGARAHRRRPATPRAGGLVRAVRWLTPITPAAANPRAHSR